MSTSFFRQFSRTLRTWWREQVSERGVAGATSLLLQNIWTFVRESTPEQRRQRYGDMDYDWENRVNTTSGTVAWRERLTGLFLSPYQPTDPDLFREMMTALPIRFDQFTFIDVGSGKGRALLMASEYSFQKIVGIEILPALHAIAEENVRSYHSGAQKCHAIESICADAAEFSFPPEPLVVYLFNPLPEAGFRRVLGNLERSLAANPRPVYVLYHNLQLEHVLSQTAVFSRLAVTAQYSIYVFGKCVNSGGVADRS